MINSITEVDRVIKVYLVHCGGINVLEGNYSGVQDTDGGREETSKTVEDNRPMNDENNGPVTDQHAGPEKVHKTGDGDVVRDADDNGNDSGHGNVCDGGHASGKRPIDGSKRY